MCACALQRAFITIKMAEFVNVKDSNVDMEEEKEPGSTDEESSDGSDDDADDQEIVQLLEEVNHIFNKDNECRIERFQGDSLVPRTYF